jgi:hypothetical protein
MLVLVLACNELGGGEGRERCEGVMHFYGDGSDGPSAIAPGWLLQKTPGPY